MAVVCFGGGSRRGDRGPLRGCISLDRKPSLGRAEGHGEASKSVSASRSLAVSVGPLGLAVVRRLS